MYILADFCGFEKLKAVALRLFASSIPKMQPSTKSRSVKDIFSSGEGQQEVMDMLASLAKIVFDNLPKADDPLRIFFTLLLHHVKDNGGYKYDVIYDLVKNNADVQLAMAMTAWAKSEVDCKACGSFVLYLETRCVPCEKWACKSKDCVSKRGSVCTNCLGSHGIDWTVMKEGLD
jgi:hypothetical protein